MYGVWQDVNEADERKVEKCRHIHEVNDDEWAKLRSLALLSSSLSSLFSLSNFSNLTPIGEFKVFPSSSRVSCFPGSSFFERPGVTKSPCMIPSAFRQVDAARCPTRNWARYSSFVQYGSGFGCGFCFYCEASFPPIRSSGRQRLCRVVRSRTLISNGLYLCDVPAVFLIVSSYATLPAMQRRSDMNRNGVRENENLDISSILPENPQDYDNLAPPKENGEGILDP
ncbi:hypothetical protein HPB51_022529 [Rhipicephalus microplus]|uniref:Uncharacterized protein n=1 Tax=Rhipicephalus microplus TaxID=6941 RepID=A0A9J6ECT0_RHIMP|nr:hypothetical protein HPB51_022529 [Rhipicephalus microplus]